MITTKEIRMRRTRAINQINVLATEIMLSPKAGRGRLLAKAITENTGLALTQLVMPHSLKYSPLYMGAWQHDWTRALCQGVQYHRGMELLQDAADLGMYNVVTVPAVTQRFIAIKSLVDYINLDLGDFVREFNRYKNNASDNAYLRKRFGYQDWVAHMNIEHKKAIKIDALKRMIEKIRKG